MNKFIWVCLLIILSTGLLFTACNNDPYKNMKLIVDVNSVEIILDNDTDINEDDNEGEDNTQTSTNVGYIKAHIENKNKKQSKVVLFDVADKSIAKIDVQEKDGIYTATITALSAGETIITVMSQEGNKIQQIPLKVVVPITGLAFKKDFSLAVAVGNEYQFNESNFLFEPQSPLTNQREVKYSLETATEGVSITEDGLLTVTQKPANKYVTVIATSVYNSALTTTTDVYIYDAISTEDVHIYYLDKEIIDTIQLGKNSSFNNINLEVRVDNAEDEYIAYAIPDDVNVLKAERFNNGNLIFSVTGLEQSSVKLTFKVGINGITQQEFVEKTITVNVIDLIKDIYVNKVSQNSNVVVFDKYGNSAETLLGTKILIETEPNSASNRELVFSVKTEDLENISKLDFYDAQGNLIENIAEYKLQNSGIIYVKINDKYIMDATFEDFSCVLTVVGNHNFSDEVLVYNNITINAKKGIDSIEFVNNNTYIDYQNTDYQEFQYIVNDTIVNDLSLSTTLKDFDLNNLRIYVKNSNIIDAKIENGKLYIKPISAGSTSITLITTNGITTTPANITVVVPAHNVVVDVDRNQYNEIAGIERDENDVLSKININTNSIISLYLNKDINNATIWDLQYSSSETYVATINNQGVVRTLSQGTTILTINYKYAQYDEEDNFTIQEISQEIELFVFNPITTFDIGKSSAILYDVNTIGYLDASKYSITKFEVMMNSNAYMTRKSIYMYINNEKFEIADPTKPYVIEGQYGILYYEGDGKATFLARINNNADSALVGVIAEINEFDRTYKSICDIRITKATTVNEINLYNIDNYKEGDKTYYNMYFKAGLGLGQGTDNTQKITANVSPTNVTNKNLYYFAYDYLLNNEISKDTKPSEIISVSQDGVVTPLKAGSAKIIIVPCDRLNNDINLDGRLSNAEILANLQKLQAEGSELRYKEIIVNVADGTLENPYLISNAVDFLNISKSLSSHYVLTQNIDLRNVNLSCFGSLQTPFTGSLSGRYYLVKPNDENESGVYIDSKIIGIKLNQTFENVNENVYFGLFGVVQGTFDAENNLISSFSNLYLEFESYNITINNSSASNISYYLGLLSAQFQGRMDNVQIVFRNNAQITNNANAKIIFGSLSANVISLNEGSRESIINLCKTSGNGNVNISSLADGSFVGGLVGVLNEKTKIQGQNAFTNDIIAGDEAFVFSFNGQNDDARINFNITTNINTNMAVGGVIGLNYGEVNNISAYSQILVRDELLNNSGYNIGGVVGYNLGIVSDVFSRCAVVGHTNVGGVIGLNESQVNLAVFESYQDASSYVNGYENVGGLIGQMNGGSLIYGSSTSFGTLDNYDDASVDDSSFGVVGYNNVGGLIGYAHNNSNIQKSYSNTKIRVYAQSEKGVAGGFIGRIESVTISNSYSISDLYKVGSYEVIIGGFVGSTISACTISYTYSISNIDNYIGDSTNTPNTTNSFYFGTNGTSGGADAKTQEELKNTNTYASWNLLEIFNIKSDVNEGYPYLLIKGDDFLTSSPSAIKVVVNETKENEYIKVSDNQVVILKQTNINNTEDYQISFNELLTLNVTPSTNRVVRVKATVVEGFNVATIIDGDIVFIGEGYCKIKIASQLNENIFDYLELYVTNGLESFINNYENNLTIQLEQSKELRYEFTNGDNTVGNEFGIAYKDLFTYASMNFSETLEIDGTTYNFVDYTSPKIIQANEVIENHTFEEIAYINANFGGNYTKVLLPWTKNAVNLSIYNGVTNLQLDKKQVSITPSQTTIVKNIITTDLETDFVNRIQIINNDNIINEYEIYVLDGQEINKDNIVINKIDSNATLFEIKLLQYSFDKSTKEMIMLFEIVPTVEVQNTNANTTYNINFAIVDENFENKFSQRFDLTLLPQTIEKISILHYPDGNLQEEEVASDKISSGIQGLLKINVYPAFSQVDYINIVSNVSNGEKITFVQYINNNGILERIYPDATIIDNGIKLSLASFNTINGYAFDGNLYVSTLIRSNMPENIPFVITVTAYKDGKEVFSQSKTLTTQFGPQVKINYNSNYNQLYARGTSIQFPIAVNTMEGNLKLEVLSNDITNAGFDPTSISFSTNKTNFGGMYVGQVTATLNSSVMLQAGTKIRLRVTLETVVENIRMVVVDELDLTIVDYIILGTYVEGSRVANNTNYLDISLNSATNLKARLQTLYAVKPSYIDASSTEGQEYQRILNNIQEFERLITAQNGANGVWFTGIQSFDEKQGSTEYYKYNYSLTNNCYSVYGIKIGAVDKIILNFAFYYDYVEGQGYQPILFNKNTGQAGSHTVFDYSSTNIVNVEDTTTEEVPLPIYSQKEFEAMEEGAHYILMKDINLESYTPKEALFASLDGNGFVINVNSWLIENDEQGEVNVGLFTKVSSQTTIKNVVVNVNKLLNSKYDLTNKTQVNFGFIAGVNEGIITNTEVMNITKLGGTNFEDFDTVTIETSLLSSTNYTDNYIGLFVGQNNGYITNSRVGRDTGAIGSRNNSGNENIWKVKPINLIANGTIAGFVAKNDNIISSSFAKNITLNNSSVVASVSATAGFVAYNNGKISSSYAENTLDSKTATIKSKGSIGGFVYNNSGQIDNSYSSFVIRSSSTSSGFVMNNTKDAKINYSYTSSQVATDIDNAMYRPFTGVNDYNELQNAGTIEYCYYIKDATTTVFADDPASPISKEDATKQNNYIGFSFVNNNELSKYGVWSMNSESLPYINSANSIAISQRELSNNLDATSQEEVIGEPMIYAYLIGYELGQEINPYLIDSAVKFDSLIESESVDGVFGNNLLDTDSTKERTTKHIRIIKNLNFAETSATSTGLSTSKIVFSGVLDGNNMTLSNINLTGEISAEKDQKEFGLFERLNAGIIKNISLQYNSVSATEIPIVGALAGTAVDSIVLNVNVQSQNINTKTFIQGKNVTGGLLGIVVGQSEIQAISSDVGVRSTYRNATNNFNDLTFEVKDEEDTTSNEIIVIGGKKVIINYNNTSYAGGIFGAVISYVGDTQSIRTLKVSGNVAIGAERTGGIVGVNYGDLYDLNFVVKIDESTQTKQELSGDDVIGGIIGVNYNAIDKARITYEGDNLTLVNSLAQGVSGGKVDLFIGKSNYIGGLVGANINGTIIDSYSRVNVVNTDAKYAGGLIGYNQCGKFDSIYTTGNVQSSVAFGGMFGYMDEYKTLIDGVETTQKISTFNNIVLANNYTVETSKLVDSKSVNAGALAGYANVNNISQLFDYIASIGTNYSVYNMPLNSAGTSYSELKFFGSAIYNRLEETLEEYNAKLNLLNDFKDDETSYRYNWFDTKNGDFANASYNTIYNNSSVVFNNYNYTSWTKDGYVFPILKITMQASEIVIDDSNKNEFVKLINENPNGTFIIKCDIALYSGLNGGTGDLNEDWVSIGNEILPFSGSFIGEKFTDGDGNERYPVLKIQKTFINFARNARLSNLTFELVNSINENIVGDLETNYYFGLVGNRLERCSLNNINLTNNNIYSNSVTIQKNNTLQNEDNIPNNYIGLLVGYSEGGIFSNITNDINLKVTTQTSNNVTSLIPSYVGGVIGYSNRTTLTNITNQINYDLMKDGTKSYQSLSVESSNISFGSIVGYANFSDLTNLTVQEVCLRENIDGTSSSLNAITVKNITNNQDVSTDVIFGGVIGYSNSTRLSGVNNELSSLDATMQSHKDKSYKIGGLVGLSNNSTITDSNNKAKITVTNNDDSGVGNELYIGGIVGLFSSKTQLNATNNGEIVVNLTKNTNTAYIGGLVGNVDVNTAGAIIDKSRNTANIMVNGVQNLYAGGILGRAYADNSAISSASIEVSQSYSDGNITIQGVNNGVTTEASIEYIGGLIGFANRINVANCYSVGYLVSQTKTFNLPTNKIGLSIGGLIGRLEHTANVNPTIYYSYSACVVKTYADAIKNSIYSQGFIGSTSLTLSTSATFNTCYYALGFAQTNSPKLENMQTAPNMHDITANAVKYLDLTRQSTYSNSSYDFTNVWVIENNSTLPLLRWATVDMGDKKSVGSVYQPYQISSLNSFKEINAGLDNDSTYKYFVLNTDIDADGIEWQPIDFNGIFDGSGYSIINLKAPIFNNLGVNAVVSNVNFKNFKLEITTAGNNGIVANSNKGSISYVSTSGEITFSSNIGDSSNPTNVGGVVGANYGYIAFSSNYTNISLNDIDNTTTYINVGGIAGYMGNIDNSIYPQISNSYNAGTLSLHQTKERYLGGLVGYIKEGVLRESYVFGRIIPKDATILTYGAVFGGDTDSNFNVDNVAIQNVYNDYLGTLYQSKQSLINNTTLGEILQNGIAGFDSNVWRTFANDYNSRQNSTLINYGYPYLKYAYNSSVSNKGNGTKNNAYKITNQSGFAFVNYLESKKDSKIYYYILENDIYCYSQANSATNIANLNGILDGGEKTVYNMNILITNTTQGLINNLGAKGELKNITFNNLSISFDSGFQGATSVGTIIATNSGSVNNVDLNNVKVIYPESSVSAGEESGILSIGGFVGTNNGDIKDVNTKNIEFILSNTTLRFESARLGGFVGTAQSGSITESTIENIKIYSNKTDDSTYVGICNEYQYVGGFVGYRPKGTAFIEECEVSDSDVRESNQETVNQIYVNMTNADKKTYIGGFLGYSYDDTGTNVAFESCVAYSYIDVQDAAVNKTFIGGIAGYAGAVMNDTTVFTRSNITNNSIYKTFGRPDNSTAIFTNTTEITFKNN